MLAVNIGVYTMTYILLARRKHSFPRAPDRSSFRGF